MIIFEYLKSFYIIFVFLCINLIKVTSYEKHLNDNSSDSNNSFTNANQINLGIFGVHSMLIFCSIITISVLVASIAILTFIMSKKQDFKNKIEETIRTLNSSSDKHWIFSENQLKLGKILSSDVHCVVHHAKAYGIVNKNVSTTVAVKAFKNRTNSDLRLTQALILELRSIRKVASHLNIVDFLGMCFRRKTCDLLVIADYFPLGSVHQYILDKRDGFFEQITQFYHKDFDDGTMTNLKAEDPIDENVMYPWKDSDSNYSAEGLEPIWLKDFCRGDEIEKPLCTYDLLCWSYQVAKGMAFLASQNIHHGNLMAKNIMLADRRVVKISDYGLTQAFYNNTDGILVNFKWMAVELINSYKETRCYNVSPSTDVWAFGVVLWELFSLADTPYKGLKVHCDTPMVITEYNLLNAQRSRGIYTVTYTLNKNISDNSTFDLLTRLLEGWRMEQPEFADIKIYNFMLDCWKADPVQRPTFTELTERLGNFLQYVTKKGYDDLNDIYVRLNSKTVNVVNATAPDILNCLIEYENHTD